MNLVQDPRQLKTKVTLSILNAPESGFFSGEYTSSSASKSQDNLNVLNYDFDTYYTYSDGATEPKYSKRLKVLSSLQNARIPEVNTAISASSCTFAFGSIVPGEVDPVLNKLKGPIINYNPVFVDEPIQGAVKSQSENFDDVSQHVPKIPFADNDITASAPILTTYNIWNIVDGTQEAYKYIGPAIQGVNTGTLRTVKDPAYGAQIEVTSEKTNTTIKRIYPLYYDAVYEEGATIFNPDGSSEPIEARGYKGNNGFHINFSVSNMQINSSAFRIAFRPSVINDNYINDFYIEFKIDSKPVVKIYDPELKDYRTQTEIIAPVLDKNNMSSYDVFVHFVGPNMLLGFTPDITRWNTLINFSGREIYCPKDTEIFISLSNTNMKFRYSAIIFNNYNNDQPVNSRKNYIVAEIKYSQKKINPNNEDDKILTFIKVIKSWFELSSYRINVSPGNTGYNPTNPKDKNISYFADSRLVTNQFEDITSFKKPKSDSADPDKKTVLFKLVYKTTIEGPAFLQIEVPHPGVLVSNGFTSVGTGNGLDYTFTTPALNQLFYSVGDITSWVERWTVTCDSSELSNLSRIKKTASITLRNIDSEEGQAYINAIENNLLVVTIDSGYGELYTYFQGFITNSSYSRSGNDSKFELTCIDVGTFTLGNVFFEKNMMIAGMRHDLAIDSIMAASGFWSYYSRDDADLVNGGRVYGIDLRLNSTSTNNQDLIKLNPLDKVIEKLDKLLERLNNPYSLPTFRWAENYGFKLECRNNYLDNDLKFTGLNSAGSGYDFNSNASNSINYLERFKKDIHGLLVDEYTIDTDMNLLSSGVRVFGVAMTGFLADERFSPGSVSLNNLPIQTQIDLLGYLSNTPFTPAQPTYVGFKKYINWATQRNEIPDYQVLKRITDSIELVSKTPISNISFSCYVTKPLNFHGKFKINVTLENSTNATDLYVYKSVSYTYSKTDNLITAVVSGTNLPISLRGA